MTPRFYDGVYAEANRTNEANGQSFHIAEPASDAFGRAVIFVALLIVVGVGLAFVCASGVVA